MGLTCNYQTKEKRPSFYSKSCNENFKFSPIDEDSDEGRNSKKENAKIQKTKKNKGPKSNSKTKTNKNLNNNKIANKRNNSQKKTDNKSKKEIPRSNNNNSNADDKNNNNNNKENDDFNVNNKDNDNDKDSGKIKSYLDFNNNSKYFIICPACKSKVPGIKDTEYDEDKNDFSVEYFCYCNCNSAEEDKKSYFINFICDNKPENLAYSFESLDKLKSMIDLVRDKQYQFEGLQILEKIYKDLNTLRKKMSFNKSMAPPANMMKSLVDNKNN